MINLLLLATLALQQPAPIRVTTRMVEVGVSVRDQKGRPITDLKADDFRLFDGGREENIRTFAAPGPERTRPGAETHIATAILFDYLNSTFSDESRARVQLLRLLREMEPRQPIALLSLDAGFQVLHDFSTDLKSLIRALESYHPYRPIQAAGFPAASPFGRWGPLPAADAPGAQSMFAILKLDGTASRHYAMLRSRQTASASAALAAFLARTPGRKNLLWISTAFPGSLAAAVRKDDVAVYPIDVTSFQDPPRVMPGPGRMTLTTGWYSPRPTKVALALAERTGGLALDYGNDMLGGMRRSIQDGDSIYMLGYYPSHGQWDGSMRPIQVSAKRSGTTLRHRHSYAAALEGSFRAPDPRETLWDVAASPAEARGVLVDGQAARLPDGAVELTLTVDNGPGPDGGLEVMAVPVRADGQLLEADYFTAKPASRAAAVKRRISPPAEASKLRIVVRQARSGALGSTNIPLSHAN